MKNLIILFAFSLLSFSSKKEISVQYDVSLINSKEIPYSKSNKINWRFFEKRQKSNSIAAETMSGITYSVDDFGSRMDVRVVCFFDTRGSYFTEGNDKPYILNHEQRHFDLTYIYTMKFINLLKNENNLNSDKIDYIYNKINDELGRMQSKYDLETIHSTNIEIQNKWNKIIDNELVNL